MFILGRIFGQIKIFLGPVKDFCLAALLAAFVCWTMQT